MQIREKGESLTTRHVGLERRAREERRDEGREMGIVKGRGGRRKEEGGRRSQFTLSLSAMARNAISARRARVRPAWCLRYSCDPQPQSRGTRGSTRGGRVEEDEEEEEGG